MNEQTQLNFKRLAEELLINANHTVSNWLPGGKLIGDEYTCASLSGGEGSSCKVNIRTGKWADFATGDKGGDLISLHAKINNISQKESYLALGGTYVVPSIKEKPDFKHKKYGEPSSIWEYKNKNDEIIFYIARYEADKKQFIPYTFSEAEQKWQKKALKAPRPLFGLEQIKDNQNILLVEGEKAAVAARKIATSHAVLTWSGGSKAWKQTDFSPLHGKNILLWPDNDKPGHEAMEEIVKHIYEHCPEIKILKIPDGTPPAWDAADANMSPNEFAAWADNAEQLKPIKDRIQIDAPPKAQTISTIARQRNEYEILDVKTDFFGKPINDLDNAMRVLEEHGDLRGRIWFDDFHQKIFVRQTSGEIKPWTDADDLEFLIILQRQFGFHQMPQGTASAAINAIAYRNRKNEPKDWMESLKWDGNKRCSHFMSNALGAPDNEYTQAVSQNFWISMAARIYQPGCKFDNMVILEGPQGKFKSTAMKTVVGEKWYVESNESLMDKDFYLQMQGKLIIEIGELDGFSKAEVTTIKKVISTATDRFRAPYDRRAADHPRQSIFVGTTNEDVYLRDHTGGRRFWPIKVGKIDIDMIEEHREQMFAEAVYLYKSGETWWEVPQDVAELEQESRRQIDPWEELIADWVECQPVKLFTIEEIWRGVFNESKDRLDRHRSLRISNALRLVGYDTKQIKIGNRNKRRWFPLGHDVTDLIAAYQSPASHEVRSLFGAVTNN